MLLKDLEPKWLIENHASRNSRNNNSNNNNNNKNNKNNKNSNNNNNNNLLTTYLIQSTSTHTCSSKKAGTTQAALLTCAMFLSKMECRSLIILFPVRNIWDNQYGTMPKNPSHVACHHHVIMLPKKAKIWFVYAYIYIHICDIRRKVVGHLAIKQPQHPPYLNVIPFSRPRIRSVCVCPSTSCSWRRFRNKQASLSHQLSKASSTAPGCCMKSVKAGDFGVWTDLQFIPCKWWWWSTTVMSCYRLEIQNFDSQYQKSKSKPYLEVGRINYIIKNP